MLCEKTDLSSVTFTFLHAEWQHHSSSGCPLRTLGYGSNVLRDELKEVPLQPGKKKPGMSLHAVVANFNILDNLEQMINTGPKYFPFG